MVSLQQKLLIHQIAEKAPQSHFEDNIILVLAKPNKKLT
jgi:hypothetical protein